MDEQRQRAFAFKWTEFLWLVTGVIEGLIGLRVLLKMLGANPANPFAVFVYGITHPLLWPFSTLTAQPKVGSFVFEIGSIIAMLVYGLLAWVLVEASSIILYPMRNRPPRGGDSQSHSA